MIILFVFFNQNRLKHYINNKHIIGASCVIVTGGFEGLGDPVLDEQHETPKATRRLNSSHSITALEMERDSYSRSVTQTDNQRQIEDSKGKLTEVNPEGKAVPIPIDITTGIRNSAAFKDFKYLTGLGNPCPWAITPPIREIPSIPLCSSEGETDHSNTSDHTIKKKVRFKDCVQVVEIERVEQNLEKINNKFYIASKYSNSEASPNLISHGHGQLNNPASNRDLQSIFKGLFKK